MALIALLLLWILALNPILGEEATCDDPLYYVPDCRDEVAECPEWAQAGQCESSSNVKAKCRKSCPHVCNDGSIDLGEPQEADNPKTRELISETLEYMHKVVYKDPDFEAVRQKCKNKHAQCSFWASIGECDKNPNYMKTNCAAACQTCWELDFNTRCQWDPNQELAWQAGDLERMFQNLLIEFNTSIQIISQPPNPWVVVIDEFLSKDECEALIALGQKRGYERSQGGAGEVNGEYQSAVSDYRTSFQTWCLDGCYQDATTQQVSAKIAKATGVSEPHSEYLQLLKYTEGQYYKEHIDFIPVHVRRPMGPRILTVFLYLNNPEEGGATRFSELDLTVEPKQGRALIWPSVLDNNPMAMDGRTIHEALPVIKGEKYGANAWLHQGDFKKAFDDNCSFN